MSRKIVTALGQVGECTCAFNAVILILTACGSARIFFPSCSSFLSAKKTHGHIPCVFKLLF